METTKKKVEGKIEKEYIPATPMSRFVDNLLLKGGTLDNISKKAMAEADRRKIDTLSTRSQIISHARYRISKGMKIKLEDEKVLIIQ